ncbi:hypothetical protein FHT91_002436 [Rhizobium sp. BK347]|nr:hypothetical protein [Rhizobium sp. BK252]MBB3402204.1 hypothetical protein [Rhizobium sp. BK289]MBB3414781.1 hypothetical protein [Rhizobium sp. BK284]MBB3482670.1 hypothetical protein [Rhizobium sp. BK347]
MPQHADHIEEIAVHFNASYDFTIDFRAFTLFSM